jgi:hypothetical protein
MNAETIRQTYRILCNVESDSFALIQVLAEIAAQLAESNADSSWPTPNADAPCICLDTRRRFPAVLSVSFVCPRHGRITLDLRPAKD